MGIDIYCISGKEISSNEDNKTRYGRGANFELCRNTAPHLKDTYFCVSRCTGCFGAIPWDAMSFVLLILEWKDFTKEQIISYQFIGGICGTVGAFLGGALGLWYSLFHLVAGWCPAAACRPISIDLARNQLERCCCMGVVGEDFFHIWCTLFIKAKREGFGV
jgi:hypothetical protein